jgi:hypothetical protein
MDELIDEYEKRVKEWKIDGKCESCLICGDTLITMFRTYKWGLFMCYDCKKYYLICWQKPDLGIIFIKTGEPLIIDLT